MDRMSNLSEMMMYDYPELELGYQSQGVLITLYISTTILSVGGNIIVMIVLSCGTMNKTILKTKGYNSLQVVFRFHMKSA